MNSIMVIHPYKTEHGQWLFDDAAKGLDGEALICGIDEMLDIVSESMMGGVNGNGRLTVMFSGSGFPGYQLMLSWVREEFGGNWYRCDALNVSGWLCPALGKYFDTVPAHIYIGFKGGRSIA